jgi:tetratricopeptide (TPR) repeat protein
MTPLLGAQVDVLLGRFERAERIITERLKDLRAQGLSRLTACLTSDRAYCRAQRGDFDGAKSDVKTALNAISEEDHIDDLAVLHSRIANVYRLSQDLDKALEFEAKSTNLWEKFRDHQREILGGIDGIRQSDS